MTTYAEWKANWDKWGSFPVITHADADLLLTEIARLENELAESRCGHEMAADESLRRLSEVVDRDRRLATAYSVIRRYANGWKPGERMAVVMAGSPRPEPKPIWMHNDMAWDSEPRTDAEADVIRRATKAGPA